MRKIRFQNREYYHVYNQGVDKRSVFKDGQDFNRFLESMTEFNNLESVGSLYLLNLESKKQQIKKSKREKLIDIVCYCLNPNHFHILIRQLRDKGVENFMHKVGTGYTNYFNKRNKRRGSLFQGSFKAVHVNSNEHLLHLSAYINLNYKIHGLKSSVSRSSWSYYVNSEVEDYISCNKRIIMEQFKNHKEYEKFAQEAWRISKERKDMEGLLLGDVDS